MGIINFQNRNFEMNKICFNLMRLGPLRSLHIAMVEVKFFCLSSAIAVSVNNVRTHFTISTTTTMCGELN